MSLPKFEEPRFNPQLRKVVDKLDSTPMWARIILAAVVCICFLIVGIASYAKYDSTETQSRPVAASCDAYDPFYGQYASYSVCSRKAVDETREDLDTSNLPAVALHYMGKVMPIVIPAILLLILVNQGASALGFIASRRNTKALKTWKRMRENAQEEARRRLYVLTNLSKNSRNVKATGFPLVDTSDTFEEYCVSSKHTYWTPGISERTVGWFTEACYDESGRLRLGGELVVMSPENELDLPLLPSTSVVVGENQALEMRIARDLEIFRKM